MKGNYLQVLSDYSSNKINLKDIPTHKMHRSILIKASEKEPNEFIDVVLELYKNNKLLSLGLDIRKCLSMIPKGYKNQKFYDRLFETNPVGTFRLIPGQYLTQDMCSEYFRLSDKKFFGYIPHKFRTLEMYQEVYKDNPVEYFNNLPNNFKTQEMCDEYASNYLLECFEYIPDKFKTQDMCNKFFELKNSVDDLWLIPDEYKTLEMWKMQIKTSNNFSVFRSIPLGLLDQEICDIAFEESPLEVFKWIPDEFKTSYMIRKIVIRFNEDDILQYIPEELLTQEICDILFDKNMVKTFYNIPLKYRTLEMCKVMILYEDDMNVMKEIPESLLNGDICNMAFFKYSSDVLEYIPLKYRTKEMYISLLQEDIEKYSSLIPYECYDEELISIMFYELSKKMKQRKTVRLDLKLSMMIVGMYPKLLKVFNDDIKEYIIIRELKLLISTEATLKSIADKYDMNLVTVSQILEKIKDDDLESYVAIKNILANNQNKYYKSIVNDAINLNKIILMMGDLDGKFLSSLQKVKFAYLYNKYIYHSLEEIYSFNRKVFMSETNSVINKEDSFRINNFFTKYLRYNYLLGDTDVVKDIPEVKTILFNNSWLKQYNRNNFFAIKDGIVTMEHRYGNNLLTLELEEEIVNILKVNNIPLNDYIVQSAFREYFKCNLDEYINKLKEYDVFFERQNGKRKR